MFKKIKEKLLEYFTFGKEIVDDTEGKFILKINQKGLIKPYKYPLSKGEKLKRKVQFIARTTKSKRIRRKNIKRLVELILYGEWRNE